MYKNLKFFVNPDQGGDFLCLLRYVIYGALLGGWAGSLLFTKDSPVYIGAVIGAVLFLVAKIAFFTPHNDDK